MATKAEIIATRLTEISERLTLYKNAEETILQGAQSYSIGNRTLTRADLNQISRIIEKLEKEQLKLNGGGAVRLQRVVPRTV